MDDNIFIFFFNRKIHSQSVEKATLARRHGLRPHQQLCYHMQSGEITQRSIFV